MKNLLLLAFVFMPCSVVLSQNYSIHEVDQPPKLQNECKDNTSTECFEKAILKYINQNINIVKLIDNGEGTAYAQFVITELGDITDIRTRSNSKPLEKEAMRLLKEIHISDPALKNGKAVSVLYTVPVKFKKIQFESYDDFFEDDLSEDVFAILTDVSKPPTIDRCGADKDCLTSKFKKDIIKELKELNFNNRDISKLKLTFVITEESQVDNIIVVTANKKLDRAVKSILNKIKVLEPALNKNKEPVSVRLNYNFESI